MAENKRKIGEKYERRAGAYLEEKGYEVEATEVAPGGVAVAVSSAEYDLIAYTSPVEDSYDLPLLNATGFLVGLNEDEFIEELMNVVGKLKL